MNSPAKAFLLSLNCSEALAVVRPTREDAVLSAELTGGAKCESLPRRGCKCREEVGEIVQERVWWGGGGGGGRTEQHPPGLQA